MIVAGCLAFLLTLAALRERSATIEMALLPDGLEPGAPLQASELAAFSMPTDRDSAPPGLLTFDRARELTAEGAMAAGPIAPGALLREGDFIAAGVGNARTMAIPIDRSHAVGGLLSAGDLIDVISVEQGTARFVLVGAQILTVGRLESGPGRTLIVTVEVDAQSSLRLARALAGGTMEIVKSTWAPPADPGLVDPPMTMTTEFAGG